jgi:hypothetical protein
VRAAALALVLVSGALPGVGTAPGPARAASPGDTLGVYSGGGNVSGANAFGTWLGRRPAYALDFLPQQTWSDIDSDWIFQRWAGTGYQMIFSVPMLPASGATLAQGAAGAYNAHFTRMAQALVANGQGNAIIRLGWEMNGDWFAWSIKNGAASYAAYWRQIVSAMRAVAPGLRFDFCPNNGSSSVSGSLLDPSAAYPGDAYVDIVGMDVYDQSWAASASDVGARWAGYRDQPYGLSWQRSFAAAHGKPISFPEWGLWSGGTGHGGGDNPDFVQQLSAWIAASNVAYHAYFNYDAPDGNHLLSRFPRSATTFQGLFRAAAATPPAVPPPGAVAPGPVTPATLPPATVAPGPVAPTPVRLPQKGSTTSSPAKAPTTSKKRGRASVPTLRATVVRRTRGATRHAVKLRWTGLSGRTTVLRNGRRLRVVRRGHVYVDRRAGSARKRTYRVCATGTRRCSRSRSVGG